MKKITYGAGLLGTRISPQFIALFLIGLFIMISFSPTDNSFAQDDSGQKAIQEKDIKKPEPKKIVIGNLRDLKKVLCNHAWFKVNRKTIEQFESSVIKSASVQKLPYCFQVVKISTLFHSIDQITKCSFTKAKDNLIVKDQEEKSRIINSIYKHLRDLVEWKEIDSLSYQFSEVEKLQKIFSVGTTDKNKWPVSNVFDPCQQYNKDVKQLLETTLTVPGDFKNLLVSEVEKTLRIMRAQKELLCPIFQRLKKTSCFKRVRKHYQYFMWTENWDEMRQANDTFIHSWNSICDPT